MNNQLDAIVKSMATSELNYDIQKIQTEHRLKLAQFWGIKKGDKVLEIGCGQGDTTAVLAALVGENGAVHGIDIASPDYGAPLTLGESMQQLQNSQLGSRITVEFECDILSGEIDFPDNSFDVVVLSHSSWYMSSADQLEQILSKLKKWGKKLCFAEWDTRITDSAQLPHFLAVLIQAQYECFKTDSLSNIRTLFTPMDCMEIAEKAGWRIIEETSIHSPALQDGEWEVYQTIDDYQDSLASIVDIPAKFKTLIESQIKLLEASAKANTLKPMAAFTFTAE
ncbi:class I SAM-dependent methyltransferase [Ornithinibacillus contaminans]|uniref:class I SAM-dependent methyltransferase n=1 Tax=Ornithinibacillus contaminans TaxID=694055 RepID=UPI00064DA57E|nr:class I SAM-dependent methyltransferase [Ornithinibacillus contaminans]